MTTYAVVHLIHVQTPHRHIAKLFVTGVPADVSESEVRERLTEAGYEFGEFNIPWANHYPDRLKDAEAEVKGAWNRGDVERVAWDAMQFEYEENADAPEG